MPFSNEKAGVYLRSSPIRDNMHPMFILWTRAWNQNTGAVFDTEDIIRDKTTRASDINMTIPETCTAFGFPERNKRAFVRQEYLTALGEVLYYYKNPQRRRDDTPELHDTSIASLQKMVNEFKARASEGTSPQHQSITVTGHPGIGGATWLSFLLLIRLLAGLPTLYHVNDRFGTIFTQDGVHKVNTDDDLDLSVLPPHTFFLVDGNRSMNDTVPYKYKQYGHLVIHTTSCQREGFGGVRYYMRPFSFKELIIGRQFQRLPISEHQLREFHSKFGPVARTAYSEALRMATYQDRIDITLENISFTGMPTFVHVIRDASGLSTSKTSEISGQLFLVQPSSRSRQGCEITIATRYLYDSIVTALSKTHPSAVQALYQIFLGTPNMRASASYALESLAHHSLLNGGEWPIQSMSSSLTNSNNALFKSPPATHHCHYLNLGGTQESCFVTETSRHDITSVNPLTRCNYQDTETLQLADRTYYRPILDNEPAFDAFVYDSMSSTVTIFETTPRPRHSVNPKGFHWLINNTTSNIVHFRYILVTPERPQGALVNDPTSVDLFVPNEVLDIVANLPGDLQIWQLGLRV